MVAQTKAIVSIGHGNAENIYKSESSVLTGQKNKIVESWKLVGGGGVNFAARLLATGHEVYPILTIGNDLIGKDIREELAQIAQNAHLPDRLQDFLSPDGMFIEGFHTSESGIIVHKATRTILAGIPTGDMQVVEKFIHARLDAVKQIFNGEPGAIRISHLHNTNNPANYPLGEFIRDIIKTYRDDSLVFVNFGATQIALGKEFWSDIFNHKSIFQFDFPEAKSFFGGSEGKISITKVVDMLQDQGVTAIITLSKRGAIGTFTGEEDLLFAWPLEFEDFVDPTGAGDAFSAGVVSCLYNKHDITIQDFSEAMNTGRLWASYACTAMGGSGRCPNDVMLGDFYSKVKSDSKVPMLTLNRQDASQLLKLIDLAFEK